MSKNKSTVARTDDGTIQVNFTVAMSEIEKSKSKVAEGMRPNIAVAGFRKGKAPLDKVMEKIDADELLQKSLETILPEKVNSALIEHKIRPAIFPKVELVSRPEGKDWQFRALVCELPEINLGKYSQKVKALKLKAKDTQAEKEQVVIKTLLDNIKITLPKLMVEGEVDSRLSNMLTRLEKLGVKLEDYLNSVKKTSVQMREDYKKQVEDSLSIEMILSKIAQEKKIMVEKKDIEDAVKASMEAGDKRADSPEHRAYIEVVLKRRGALEGLLKLI